MSSLSDIWLAAAIASGAVMAVVRLLLWRRDTASHDAGPAGSFFVLIAMNAAIAGLLYLTLNPPDIGVNGGRLVVLTAGASADEVGAPDDIVVAMPEAPAHGGTRVPDLGTALRRHPEVRRLRVLGSGLSERDRSAIDRPVEFNPPPEPSGFIRLHLPDPVAAGGSFTVSGEIGRLRAGSVELTDPSGVVVDRSVIGAGSAFALSGAARATGLALFELKLKDAQGRTIERIDVPVEARDARPPRVIMMAGAPGPEPRFLRRWAQAAGIDLTVQLSLGAGIDLTAQPVPLTSQTLSNIDLLVIDERRWEALDPPERAAIRSATAGGMGLLLRPTGPLSETTRRDWASLGVTLTGGDSLVPVTLDATSPAVDASTSAETETSDAPELTRRDFDQADIGAVSIRDADSTPLATWQAYGSGRVGVWTVADSYTLVLTGQSARYAEFWSRMFSDLSRAQGTATPRLNGLARVGERATLCGTADGDSLVAPDGRRTRPVRDPRAGAMACAAIWAQTSGWHGIVGPDGDRGAVYIHPAGATPSLRAQEARQAMQVLGTADAGAWDGSKRARSGPSWPWFLAFLASVATLWWMERRRPSTSPPNAA